MWRGNGLLWKGSGPMTDLSHINKRDGKKLTTSVAEILASRRHPPTPLMHSLKRVQLGQMLRVKLMSIREKSCCERFLRQRTAPTGTHVGPCDNSQCEPEGGK